MPADVSDTLLPTTNAAPILYNETGAVIGLRAPKMGLVQSGRVVFLSFPLDAVPLASPAPNNRVTLLRNILNYLAPQPGTIALGLDSSEYTVPGVVTIELEAPSLAGQTQVVVTAHCATTADYIDVILPSTTRPGLFRGAFILVGATNAPGPDRVRVRDGDTITVLYYDGLNHSFVTVTAAIDLQAPVITQIAMEPDYEEAVATWDTSEPADALVQFGESVLLGRTAYATDLAVSHEVFLTGLDPDRLYYYQVVSRDAAGNTVVDDNGGQLYTFRTLRPLGVPFTDDFNSGSANWSVYSSEDTQARWTLGVPTNHSETAAHSPPDAWGSNLKGAPLDYAETFLISPAVDLRGGNQATVRFWHSYDFSEQSEYDILQVGQLVIVTNRASDPIVLAEFYDLSGGWIEETLDLTPYLGRVVYLAWFYQLLSFDTLPRAGWLVDDVSVTVANILVGTVQISNNLSQARFTLAGPRSQTGQGLSLIITNASPGQYVVTFVPVPFYQPPQSQTNILSQGGQIVFYGDYTLADTNHNGMADLWEQQYFGAGSPSQGGTGDSDGDGASDYAEFLAGTNPTNAASALGLALNVPLAGNYYLNVSAVAGRAYRLWSADPGAHWRLQTDWLRAAGATLTIPWAPGTNRGQLFRVEARP
jgi:hypothetical protein